MFKWAWDPGKALKQDSEFSLSVPLGVDISGTVSCVTCHVQTEKLLTSVDPRWKCTKHAQINISCLSERWTMFATVSTVQ